MKRRLLPLAAMIAGAQSLSAPKQCFNRRDCLRTFVGAAPFAVPLVSNAATPSDEQQGIAAVTESQLGQAFRRQVVRGAQVADKLDEKWERFSDSLRDEAKCDPNTGRRMYDNGKRKDGTSIGNPGLGELCAPEPLRPLDVTVTSHILDAAVKSALLAAAGSVKADALNKAIKDTAELVRPSFERSLSSSASEDEKNRNAFKLELYSTMRAISGLLKDKASVRAFQLAWGNALVDAYAPNANRKDFVSPFPDKDDEFSDFDYDKTLLLDALGRLTVTLNRLKAAGLLQFFEVSIPYDDYGSVATLAVDDYSFIGAEILLSEQKFLSEGPMQALVRHLFDDSRIQIGGLDTFYIDPSTTRQENYNPTQLLLSLSGLSKM